jgi:hypothetical protein
MEVLDMFENKVVKISDQILSTYLFYLVFFKEKLIDFSILINDNDLFPQYKQRLIDAINPILNTFNFDEIKIIMKPAVDDAWSAINNLVKYSLLPDLPYSNNLLITACWT